ncbi:MAG TPA: hypothetical protein VLG50_04630 [Candidatus Saccharimonadales bacterium]|nr:hypothetical protein [Candidatus Saccharimonadales bacterium]
MVKINLIILIVFFWGTCTIHSAYMKATGKGLLQQSGYLDDDDNLVIEQKPKRYQLDLVALTEAADERLELYHALAALDAELMESQKSHETATEYHVVTPEILESEFSKSCRALGLDESRVTPQGFKVAYFQAIEKNKHVIELCCLNKQFEHLQSNIAFKQFKNTMSAICQDIDHAESYFVEFFTQQNKVIKYFKAMQEKKMHGIGITIEEQSRFIMALQLTQPQALAMIQEDILKEIVAEYLYIMTHDQLKVLSKDKVKVTDIPHQSEYVFACQDKVSDYLDPISAAPPAQWR